MKNEREPFALSFCWPELALVVLVVSVKRGPFSVGSVVWRKKGHCKSRAFLLHKKRQLTLDIDLDSQVPGKSPENQQLISN